MTTLDFQVLWRDRGASRGMQDLAKHTERTSRSFKALKVGAGIALVAAGAAAVKFGTSSVKAYVEAQTAQVRLQDAFRRFPKLADTNISSLRKLNTQLALKTKFDDDATASGQAVLAQFGLTGQQLTKLTPLLQDYAAKTGKDLPAAAGVLGKAFLGNTRALKAIGIDYKMTGNKAVDFANIQRLVNEKVGGFAEKEGKSAAGQAAILRNQFGELKEAAGAQLLPALLKVGGGLLKIVGLIQDNSAIFKTLGKTIKIVFSSIAESVGVGKGSFKDFSDWVATHQEDITKAIINGAKGFVKFGITVVKTAVAGLRAFGLFADGIGTSVAFILAQYADVAHGAALAFGWLPGIGPKLLAADVNFRLFATHAHNNINKVGDGARAAADGLERKLLPGLNKAGTGLDAYGKKAVTAARSRDIVAKAENRHRDALDAATKAAKTNGKTLDSNTVAGSANRVALAKLVGTSQDYIGKLVSTHASSKKVTSATKDAKEEFIKVAQKMGLGSKAAKDLADKYFKIPKKVETKTSAPGLAGVRKNVQGLDTDINNLNSKSITARVAFTAGGTRVILKKGTLGGGITLGGPRAGSPLSASIGGPGPEQGGPNESVKVRGISEPRPPISAITGRIMSAGVNRIAKAAPKYIDQPALSPGAPGGKAGSYSAGMAGTIARLRAAGARSFTTYPGHHPSMAKARDVTPHNWKLANIARASSSVWYVIYRMMIASKNHGNTWRTYHPTNHRGDWQHTRHIHVGWYDRGGMMQPGGMAANASGRPERILSPAQTKSFDNLVRVLDRRGGGAVNYYVTLNAPNYIGSRAELKQTLVEMARRNELAVLTR